MRIVAFSDWRIQPIQDVDWALDAIDPRPDVLLYAGDDVVRFGGRQLSDDASGSWRPTAPIGLEASTTNHFVRLAKRTRLGLGAVIGNDCAPADRGIIAGSRVWNLHDKPKLIGGFGVIGLEGSPGSIGFVTYREEDASQHLRASAAHFRRGTPLIVVSHAPPRGCLDLALRFGLSRIGSVALRDFVQRNDVQLVICGHCHIGGGQTERFGRCLVVNAANHDGRWQETEGRVAVIDLSPDAAPKIEWVAAKELKTTALHGCGAKRANRLAEAGITRRNQVLDAEPGKLAGIANVSLSMAVRWQVHARAIEDRRFLPVPDVAEADELPTELLFYDIETLPWGQGEQVWLIGLQHSNQKRVVQFLAKSEAEERSILERFMTVVEGHPLATLVCYSGTDFDHNYISRRLRVLAPRLARKFERRSTMDLLTHLRRRVMPPSAGWNLKSVTHALGVPGRHGAVGLPLACAYLEWLRNGVKPNWRMAREYNEDDVRAMPLLLERVRNDRLVDHSG